ncbi:hypothetical protein [aff. Roholtiella sp. LEGE 12411]|uniref:hypothetical protein n=1 Tax=aff. Roholtiella sp. LEGE 12411 TaxID=1828822 RepID=UPI0018802256|nr:hypothetical protein [aff. Roholtiella sp. LEGE 12411]
MTFRADETQKLIADIDNLLASGGKRLSMLLSGQAQEPKEVLQRIREFLIKLQESEALASGTQNQSSEQPISPLLARFIDQGNNQSSLLKDEPNQEQSTLGIEQLKSELSGLIQPLRAELEGLLQERATLVQEIRQLEQRRSQNYSLAQQLAKQEQIIAEFLQVLMSRLVPTLTPQLTQNLANSPSSSRPSNSANVELTTSTAQPLLESSERVERLTQLSRELDQRLLSLDGTVNVVFEALQRNINTYHESLSQALARMHSKGVQGEQLMASFLNNLTQYLQQQSSSSQPSLPSLEAETQAPSALLADSVILQPTATSAETSQLSEFIQPETLSSLAINPDQYDPLNTEDLDAVLLQLGIDSPESDATSTELQQDSFELIGDEVDQLYASLFGTGNFTASASALNTPESSLNSSTNQLQQVDSAVVMPDPWSDELEAGLFNLNNTDPQETQDAPLQATDALSQSQEVLLFEENTVLAAPFGFFTLPQEEVLAIDSLPVQLRIQPAIGDTITTLTELLADTDSEQQQLEVSSSVNNTVTTESAGIAIAQAGLPIATSQVINDDDQEHLVDNYIPASPHENLLSSEDQTPSLPNISLNQEQLQQLDRDLANFDQQLNSELQPTTNLDNSQEVVNKSQDTLRTTSGQIESPYKYLAENTALSDVSYLTENQLDISPKTEKKKEVTDPVQESSSLPISNSINNTEIPINVLESVWYLGIDLGTTGISAALLNSSTFVVYPIYWSAEKQPGTTSFQQSFRLPAEVYLPAASIPHGENESTEAQEQTAPAAVAQEKVPDHSATISAPNSTNNLYSAQLKPYLQVAIPYKSEQQKWEPVLQLNEFSAGPLIWVVRSLSKLLLTLKCDRTSTTPGLIAAAVGINEQTFLKIINNIAGVICTCPSSWSEQYRFNVREAVLTSKLIQHPQQVFFVEEAIASLLPQLDGANGEQVQLSDRQGLRPAKTSEYSLVGNTLVINIGATATEMLLVDLPENLVQLTHNDFMLHSFAYAGKGIEQDIICQLLLPPKSRQSRIATQSDSKTISSNPWQWQPAIPGLDQMRWHSLGLEELELPRVGEPDITARIRLQQRLESSLLGQAVLDAALALKLILQHQDSFTLELADQRWILQRRDLESQVFIPFVRRLNRELNKLLVARGIPTEAINQAILGGGVTSVGTVNRWLRQKLPNAKIIQDLYLGENGAPSCSRVAYGLAMLPLHPQVLEIPRQQYTDYFLFTELLRLLPDRPLSFGEIIQLFESRGINTRTCQQRLLAFLEGELPPGLIPSVIDSTWLTQNSQGNSDYKAIANAPLFDKQGSLTYRPNSQQLLCLRHYLDMIKASNQQSLEEPYTVNFVLEVHH